MRLVRVSFLALLFAVAAWTPASAQVSWGTTGTNPSTICVYDRSTTRNCVPIGSLDNTAHTWTPAVPPTGMMLPAGVTGGDKGVGTINVSGGYYVNGTLLTGGGGGGVSSVGLSAPPMFTVTGSPVTSSGTLSLSLSAQNANKVFSGPASGGDTLPTFRTLVPADLATALTTPGAIGSTTPGSGAFTTLSASGTVSGTGFANRFSAPGPIGNTTPSSGAFTTLSSSGAVSGAGFDTLFTNKLASPSAIGSTTPSTGAFTTIAGSSGVTLPSSVTGGNLGAGTVNVSGGYYINGTLLTAGGGSVVSVAMSAPPIFTITGSPITSSGTLGLNLATQNANTCWAGPASGAAAAPSFRGLVSNDIATALTTPGPIGSTTANTGAFTNLSASGTLSGAGFDALCLNQFAAPGPIGSTTPNTGAFTTLSATSTVSGTGFATRFASPGPIGSTTADTGAFTSLAASGGATLPSGVTGGNLGPGTINVSNGYYINGTLLTAGGGSVVSVGLSAPPIFTVTGSPITSSGTLGLALATQNANTIWAGPATGVAAAPSFRALVPADVSTPVTTLLTTPPPIGATTPGTGAFTALSASGIVSGTGFTNRFASPGPIGNTTAGTGAFTTLSASSTVSGAGFSSLLASPPSIGSTTPGTGAFTSLAASGAVSGAGFDNLFTSKLATPPSIGATTPGTGAFTTLSASGTVSGTGFTNRFSTPGPIGNTTASSGAFTTLAASGAVSGAGFDTLFSNKLSSPSAIGNTTPSTGAFTSLSASGTVSGTGFTNRLAAPGPIGNTTASTGAFTTLSATSTVSGAGFTSLLGSPPPIGGVAPNAGSFTSLSASGAVSGTGFDNIFTSKFASPSPIGSTAANTGAFTTLSGSGGATFPSTVTGGNKGAGTVNVSGGYYVNGALLATGGNGPVPGAPFNGDFGELNADTDVLRAWGYIGDGTSHPLSGVTSVNGVNTTGFTLAQWQALLPAATALSDEMDWAAIQSYVNSVGSGQVLTIPLYGRAMINKPISTCLQQLQVQGQGLGTQILVNGNGQNAWNHCQSATPLSNGILAFKNFLVYCSASTNCGDAFNLNMPNTGAPTLVMRDITVLGGAARWANGIVAKGGGYSNYDTVAVTLGSGAISGSCMKLNTTAPFTVIIHVDHSHMFSCAVAWDISNSSTNAGFEGVRIMNSDADQVINVMNVENAITGYDVPQYMMSNVQASFFQSIYKTLGSGGNLLDLWIKNCWFVQLPPSADSGPITADAGIELARTKRVMIADNFYQVLPGASAFSMIHIRSTTSFVQIRGNRLYDISGTTLTGNIIYIDSGANNVDEFDNDYNISTFSPITNNSASRSVTSQQWIWNVSSGKCSYTGKSRPAYSFWANRIMCASGTSGTTDSSGNIFVTYPITFSEIPVPVVSNYSGVCLTAPVIVSTFTSGFTAHIPGCISAAGQNISYFVQGN